MTAKRRSVAAITAATVSILTVTVGCGGSKGAPVNVGPGNNPATATTSSASDAADRTEALAAYGGMVTTWTGMLDSGTLDPQLMLYTNGNVNSKIRGELNKMNTGGLLYQGAPKSAPTIQAIDLTTNPPTATILDCFDSRNWTPIINKGPNKGKSAVAPGQTIVPHPLTATLNKDPSKASQTKTGGWIVTDYTINTDKQC